MAAPKEVIIAATSPMRASDKMVKISCRLSAPSEIAVSTTFFGTAFTAEIVIPVMMGTAMMN